MTSSVVLWSGRGTDPTRPVRLCIDGSTFYKLYSFRARAEYYLKDFLTVEHDRHYEIVHVDNAPLLGAAVAGLTWYYARPPVQGLDYEMDVRGVPTERVI